MKAKISRSRRKPVEIKRGSVSVKIYSGNNRVADKVYSQFTLVYFSGDQRKKVRFADLGEAKREGELVATKLANGENEVLRLTSTDRAVYVQAVAHLRPLDVPLNVAVAEYVSAVKSLPVGTTIKEAIDFFKRRNPASLEKRTVRQVVDEMLATKRAAKLSEVHLRDLRQTRHSSKAVNSDITHFQLLKLEATISKLHSPAKVLRDGVVTGAAVGLFEAWRFVE